MFVGVLAMVVHGPTSAVLKPLPVIDTPVPAEPLLGVRVIVGVAEVTTKVAAATSPVLPLTAIVYVPGVAPRVTVKLVPVN